MLGSNGATAELRLAMASWIVRTLRSEPVVVEALGPQVSLVVQVDDLPASASGEPQIAVGRA